MVPVRQLLSIQTQTIFGRRLDYKWVVNYLRSSGTLQRHSYVGYWWAAEQKAFYFEGGIQSYVNLNIGKDRSSGDILRWETSWRLYGEIAVQYNDTYAEVVKAHLANNVLTPTAVPVGFRTALTRN